jgi:hypothetical protein
VIAVYFLNQVKIKGAGRCRYLLVVCWVSFAKKPGRKVSAGLRAMEGMIQETMFGKGKGHLGTWEQSKELLTINCQVAPMAVKGMKVKDRSA